MGASFWDQVGPQLLIGLQIQTMFWTLYFLCVRISNCFMRPINTETAVGDSAHDQPLPESDAAAHANGIPDVETENGYSAAEGGESTTEPESNLRIVNGGEAPKTQVTKDAATGAPARPVEIDVPHSQQEEAAE